MKSSLPTNVFPSSNLVLGDGPTPCDWMLVGEAPGSQENLAGKPFIGPSGKLLNNLLSYYLKLARSNVYVTNIVKHQPPVVEGKQRPPMVKEIKPYRDYFYEELAAVNPKVVITLGAVAGKEFIKGLKLREEHGIARKLVYQDATIIVVPWYHPAAALRSPDMLIRLTEDAERFHKELENLEYDFGEPDYRLEEDGRVVSTLLQHWGNLGIDTETTSPTRGGVFMTDEADMLGYSVSQAERTGVYVATTTLSDGMAAIIGSPLWSKICHNAKFEYKIFKKLNVEMVNFEDTKIAAYLLGEQQTGLKILTRRHLGVKPITFKQVTSGVPMSEVPAEQIAPYAAGDADNTLRLWGVFRPRLEKLGLLPLYEIEKKMVPVLAGMEQRGMGLSPDRAREVAESLSGAVEQSLSQAANRANVAPVTITSSEQLAKFLERQGAPLKKRTKVKRHYVTDAEALRSIQDWWPEFITPVLAFKKFLKLHGYVKGFITLAGPDGRLHTSFNQAGHWEEDGTGDPGSSPSTGRLSSSGPNLMNIPHHRATVGETDWGKIIRSCLVAKEGYLLMSADLGQEEPRILAIIAHDEGLLAAFLQGKDIYRPATEALYPHIICDLPDDEWAEKYEYQRFVGKTFFLAWYYGAGAGRLKTLDKDLTPELIKGGLDMITKAHPARDAYLKEIKDELLATATAKTLHGRIRWFYKAWMGRTNRRGGYPKGQLWEAAVREAANMRIQGTAGDFIKIAMPKIDMRLSDTWSRLVSTVYDEVVLEVHPDEVQLVARIVREEFRDLLPGLPLEVGVKVGQNWGEMEKV